MYLQNLMIEVTRNCNLSCHHCLRGASESKTVSLNDVSVLFKQLDRVDTLTLSGGEPFMYTTLINKILNIIESLKIPVECIYIATNGTMFNQEVLKLLLRLHKACDELVIDISNDEFHDKSMLNQDYHTCVQPEWDMFKFVNRKEYPENYNYLIKEGNALTNGLGKRTLSTTVIKTKADLEYADIYLNVNGGVIAGCDYSYGNQEYHILCDVKDLTDYYNSLEDE